MRVAIPIWEGRVSPLMDAARQLLVIDVENRQELSRSVENLPPLHIVQVVRFIEDLKVDAVICGAVSRQLESLLAVSGIQLIPWVGGEIEEIIAAYSDGSLRTENYILPGCRLRRGRRRGRGQRHIQRQRLRNRRYPEEDL